MVSTNLDTFRKSKKERLADSYVSKEEKQAERREIRKQSKINPMKGKTNKEKVKNKAMSMVMPKKQKNLMERYKSIKERINHIKYRLGKVRDGKLKVH